MQSDPLLTVYIFCAEMLIYDGLIKVDLLMWHLPLNFKPQLVTAVD